MSQGMEYRLGQIVTNNSPAFKRKEKLTMATAKKTTTKNMTLLDLQQVLGDRVRVTLDNSLTAEEREIENEQSYLVANLAKQMINNGDLILRTEKLAAQTKSLKESMAMKLITG